MPPNSIASYFLRVFIYRFVEPPVLNMAQVVDDSTCRIPLIFVLSPGVVSTAINDCTKKIGERWFFFLSRTLPQDFSSWLNRLVWVIGSRLSPSARGKPLSLREWLKMEWKTWVLRNYAANVSINGEFSPCCHGSALMLDATKRWFHSNAQHPISWQRFIVLEY